MAGHGSQWLLKIYILLMLAWPPKGHMGTLGQLPEDMEPQAMGPETTPLWVTVALSLVGLALELLLMGIVLRCCFGRRLWRCWGEKRQSPSVSAGPCCCWGRGCCQELPQGLRHSHALTRLCRCHSSAEAQAEESGKTPAAFGRG